MNKFSLIHLCDQVLLDDLGALVAHDRANTAALLAHIAEVDARKLYLPAACPSMYEYCLQELRLSEDEAFVRIRAARTARQHPAVFTALAGGRLSLSAVLLLAPYLTRENAGELLAAAAHQTCSEIREILAEHFPRQGFPASVEPLRSDSAGSEECPACEPELSVATKRVGTEVSRPRVQPLSSEHYALQCTISRETHEKLLYAQALLRHQIPSGDLSEVLDQALDALILSLEKAKFAATARPRSPRQQSRSTAGSRYVPAEVKRAVWERDQGQRTFGAGFMRGKREHAQLAAEGRRARAAAEQPPELDVIPWLRKLGFRADEARRAAQGSGAIPGESLEERVRAALACLDSRRASHGRSTNRLACTDPIQEGPEPGLASNSIGRAEAVKSSNRGERPDCPAFSQDQSNSPRRDLSGECSVHIAPARPNWRLASLIISGAFRRANHSGRKAGLCPDEKFEPERKCTPGKSGNPLRQSINPIFLRSGAHRKSVR